MQITANFGTGIPVTVSANDWDTDSVIETFFDMGAITVTTKTD